MKVLKANGLKLACLFVLALVAGACGGSDASEGAAATDPPAETTTSASEAETTEPESDDDEAGTTEPAPIENDDDDSEAGDGDTSCIVGSWIIPDTEMNGYYSAVTAGLDGAGVSFTVVGDTGLDLNADGTYLYTPDFELELDAGGVDGGGVTSGELAGSYTVEDGIITTSVERDDLDIVVTVAGITMTAAEMGMDMSTFAPIASAPIECVDGVPVIGFELADTGERYPVTLTPA